MKCRTTRRLRSLQVLQLGIEEEFNNASLQYIKKILSAKYIPIVLINAQAINPYLESSPHWVVVSGYNSDSFFINDPYSDSTITIEADTFKSALGFENNQHIIVVDSSRQR